MQNIFSKSKGCACALALFVGAALTNAHAAPYPAPEISGPASPLTFPQDDNFSFAAFSPTVTQTNPAADAPAIAEWTRSNQPGDTMALTGESLSLLAGSEVGRDTRFLFYSESSGFVDGLIQLLDGQECALTLPSSLPANEMYLLWPRNDNGYGKPVAINQAESWWMSDKASANGSFSIYGRNLKLGSNDTYAYCPEKTEWLKASSANPYKADFVVPASWANGTYTIYPHNGFGREYGFGDPQTLTVYSPIDWDAGTTRNVMSYGASGTGNANDRTAIQNAINASSYGDTVYFPNGTYAIGASLTCNKDGIRFLGQSRAGTVITAYSGLGNNIVNMSGRDDMRFEKLTFDCGTAMSDITPFFTFTGSENSTFDTVKFTVEKFANHTHSTQNGFEFTWSYNLRLTNCVFELAGLVNMNYSRHTFVDGCDFYGLNDVHICLNHGKCEEGSFTRNTFQNYDNSNESDNHGWGVGRFYFANLTGGRTANVYFGDNETIDMTPRDGFWEQNSGEQYMMEYAYTDLRASVTTATSNTVVISDISSSLSRRSVAIVNGKGYGQVRDIVSMDTGTETITVSKNWDVIPDSTSTIMVSPLPVRHAIYNNRFDGSEKGYLDVDKSSSGIMLYGAGAHIVAENNTMNQLKFGVQIAKLQSVAGSEVVDRPIFFNLFASNSITRTQRAINFLLSDYGASGQSPTYVDKVILGNTFRNNSIRDVSSYGIWHRVIEYQPQMDGTTIDLTVYDSNHIEDWGGYFIDNHSLTYSPIMNNTVYARNTFATSSSGTGIGIEPEDSVVFHKNTWDSGFTTKYAGNPPGSILELPVRVSSVDVSNITSQVPILNVGTAPLNWQASSSQPWLKLKKTSGSVADENSADILEFEVDTAIAPSMNAEAVITVTGGAEQMRQLTVEYATEAALPPPPDPPPAPVLTGIEVSGPASISEGTPAQYTCTASYSDGTTAQVDAAWTDNSANAVVDGSGLLTAGDVLMDQSVTITATYDGLTDNFDITILNALPVLDRIEIAGPAALDEGFDAQYSCTAYYSDGSSVTVTPGWSENRAATTIDSAGLLTAGDVTADQNVTITASYGGQTDTHAVTIRYVPPVVTSLAISGPTSLDEETTKQYSCTANWSDGTSTTVVPTWNENSPYAAINAGGFLTAGDVTTDRSLTITASYGGKSDTLGVTILYVEPPVVVTGISISGPAELDENSTANFSCTASYSDGTTASVNPSWSENAGFASINSSGIISVGNIDIDSTLTVTAAFQGFTDTQVMSIRMAGTQIVYPLTGFSGKLVRARLWDDVEGELIPLGEMNSPDELLITDVNSNQWYWVVVEEYDEGADNWVRVHENWISM